MTEWHNEKQIKKKFENKKNLKSLHKKSGHKVIFMIIGNESIRKYPMDGKRMMVKKKIRK